MKKTIRDVDVNRKRILVRCDFNVPMQDGVITDDIRITSALPTIRYLTRRGARVILMSHLGRPNGKADVAYSLEPVARALTKLLKQEVVFISAPQVISSQVTEAAGHLEEGQVMLLENVRFRKEETENKPGFAKELAELGELFVDDAFGTAHRAHCSTVGIAKFLPAVSGFLMEKEMKFLGDVLERPERPFVAITGGAKVEDKIVVMENLLKKVDTLIIGGGMSYTFFKAQGLEIGASILDRPNIGLAEDLMKKAKATGVNLMLPVDAVCAKTFSNDSESAVYDKEHMPADEMGLDIGPETVKAIARELESAKTVLWNGPMGVFEMPSFEAGTKGVAEALAKSRATTIISGGDLAAAVKQFGLDHEMTHISTGGGASLEFLEGEELPGIAVLEEKV